MKVWVALIGLLACVVLGEASSKIHPLSDEFISNINNMQTTWKAGRNFDINISKSKIKALLGVLPARAEKMLPIRRSEIRDEIPETFDSREAWPACESISHIRDQAECGSCWAVAAAEAMSDRICIQSNQKLQVNISAADLLTCCTICGMGCDGGYPEGAWAYWMDMGLVTGGDYGNTDGCKSYPFPSCEHHVAGSKPSCGESRPTPDCVKACDEGSKKNYNDDKRFGVDAYYVDPSETQIQQEILTNGPVEAGFMVYEDFLSYKSGVYQQVSGSMLGGHAVKIFGWGEENGVKYWLVANSWNEEWGDNGLFKIIRGQNECGFEENITAGIPKK